MFRYNKLTIYKLDKNRLIYLQKIKLNKFFDVAEMKNQKEYILANIMHSSFLYSSKDYDILNLYHIKSNTNLENILKKSTIEDYHKIYFCFDGYYDNDWSDSEEYNEDNKGEDNDDYNKINNKYDYNDYYDYYDENYDYYDKNYNYYDENYNYYDEDYDYDEDYNYFGESFFDYNNPNNNNYLDPNKINYDSNYYDKFYEKDMEYNIYCDKGITKNKDKYSNLKNILNRKNKNFKIRSKKLINKKNNIKRKSNLKMLEGKK